MLKFIFIGLIAGVSAGFFGIGGGTIIVPALVLLAGFSQQRATGTSLAILLPPLGAGAVYEYAKKGAVDWQAAIVIGLLLAIGAWLGGKYATSISESKLQLSFGVFALLIGVYTISIAIVKMRAGV